ncbi:class I SAM-dependent methyltransferase [Bacillus tianshenii]|nr:class I SAM-dependent methyltransferase [Bacillus tianshenii]
MTEHYFSNRPSSAREPFSFSYQLRGFTFTFHSDRGVFSKQEVDFGSRLLIELFEEPSISGELLDIGCGYGPVGLALAKSFPARNIVMSDINERAIELAKQNAEENQVSNVEVFPSDVFSEMQGRKFAAILTNPPIRAGKQVVHQIFEEAFGYLEEQGELWVVIQKKQGAPSALEKLEKIYSEVEVLKKKKGYYIIRAIKS